MIFGAHVIIFSNDASADRAFLQDVLGFPSVDAGHDWLIFALPTAELAVHPSDDDLRHELYLMCDDVEKTIAELKSKGVVCSEVRDAEWGLLTSIALPSGGKLGMYQPRHALAIGTK